jgi:putative protein kinase ArgK-like GTPase of G3E family
VPFDRNPNFTGREPQLARLEDKLVEQGQTTKVAVIGLGGVGKTQVTLEFVYRVKDKHRNCSVIWLPATNPESVSRGGPTAPHSRLEGGQGRYQEAGTKSP